MILGIDLGTTNCCMAVVDRGRVFVIPNSEGMRTTPAFVALSQKGERFVGEKAGRQAITNPIGTIFSVKRFMGRKYAELQHELKLLPYEIAEAKNGDAHVKIGNKLYSPPELSAMILQKLIIDAETYIGEKITQSIISVPNYFNDIQRQAVKDAGRIAGLVEVVTINESSAALIAYGYYEKLKKRIAVYGLGGGTVSVSVNDIEDGVFEVRSSNGDTNLGGDDFDAIIINWLASEFQKEKGIELLKDGQAKQRLKEAAEKAKIELSSSQSTDINLPFIANRQNEQLHLNVTLTRFKMEQLITPLIERNRSIIIDCLKEAQLTSEDIDGVILVGGMTRMHKVAELVEKEFGRRLNKNLNPDEAVAIGAAIQGGVLGGQIEDVVLLDVNPLSLGIETTGGRFTKIIERNTTIPTRKSKVFSTEVDSQQSVELHVLQGEFEMAQKNKSIGRFHIIGIPSAPHGVPQIEVDFDITLNSGLRITAKNFGSDKELKIMTTVDSGLSENDIRKLVKEAEPFFARDKQVCKKNEFLKDKETDIDATKKKTAVTLAIDFGTTRTKVAFFDGREGRSRLIDLGREVRTVIPSLFYLPKENEGSILVGDDAYEMLEHDPEGIIIGLKKEIHRLGKKRCGSGRLAPERIELASELFRFIKTRCEEEVFHCSSISHCHLTVPVSFEEQKRECIRRAAQLAGFEEVTIIEEPVAAAMHWLSSAGGDASDYVIVCDVGGGTTDIAILRRCGKSFEPIPEIPCAGFGLGGNDIDEMIFEEASANIKGDVGDRTAGFLLKLRRIKESFTKDKRLACPVSLGASTLNVQKDIVERSVAKFVAKVEQAMRRFLVDCADKVKIKDIPILLVGGAGHLHGIKTALEKLNSGKVFLWCDSDYAAVLGAVVGHGATSAAQSKVVAMVSVMLEDHIHALSKTKDNAKHLEIISASGLVPICQAAGNDMPAALVILGLCYLYGVKVTANQTEAAACFKIAADTGYAAAQYYLGVAYNNGEGLPRD